MSRSSGGHKINDNPESDEQEQQHYDESYFDSEEEEEEEELQKSTIEKCKKPSNDELLYDPDLDEKDEIWMQRKFSKNIITKDNKKSLKESELQTDAILSCPLCFTPLSYHTQRHVIYTTQYRAIFVENCKVISTSSSNHINDNDIYFPVECEICGTKVGVFDKAQVYHFYNTIPS